MSEQLAFSDPRVLRAIQLIWREATFLDAKDYKAWEAMYTPQARYVIPIDPDTEDFEASLNMVYDDQRMRRLRVERMLQGFSPSAVAAARTVRIVSRFTVDQVSDTAVTVKSAQILNAFKRDKFSTIGAELTHEIVLGADGGEDRINLKVARLIDSEDAVSASGFLL
jgi:3-phenylpropionate/cinnamic acid dioxygenase small subunit